MRTICHFLALIVAPVTALAHTSPPYCGDEGVWIQILGSGGPELDDDVAAASYLVWVDDKARLLVDAGPGTALRFDQSGARVEDLEAIVFTHLHPDHASDFPALVYGSSFADRIERLPVLGPDGNEQFPATSTFVARMIGPDGAFPYLSDHLTFEPGGAYRISTRDVPAVGRGRWAGFGSEHLRLAAIPVHHGDVPALAWRAQVGDFSITFTGDFSNRKNVMPEFAAGTDALVVDHSIPEGTRGAPLELHVEPSEIGRIAAEAGVRMVILGHRMNRTRGRERFTIQAIEEHYDGPLIFANDLECWGL